MSTRAFDTPVAGSTAPQSALGRRLLTIPGMVLGLAVVGPTLPLLLVVALVVDLVRGGRPFSTTRITLALFCYLLIEVVGLLLLAWIGVTTRARSPARLTATYAFHRLYSRALLDTVTRLFSLRFVVHGAEVVAPGPLLVFLRHASLVDVLIAPGFIANVHQLELRYVMKRQLLSDPCMDIAGHWTPNHFVDRSGKHTSEELAAIGALKAGLPPFAGVVIWPEGTRFTLRKRAAVIERLHGEDRARAEQLKHLLPIHPGGAMTLLHTEPLCDVLFVGHHGLEGLARLGDIWRGGLVGRTVTVQFWREKAEDIPTDDAARLEWVHAHWMRIDQWLDGLPSPRPSPPRGEGGTGLT